AVDAFDYHGVANAQVINASTDGHDVAADLVPGHDRILRDVVVVVAERARDDLQVGSTDAHVCYPNGDIQRADGRNRDFNDRSASHFVDHDRLARGPGKSVRVTHQFLHSASGVVVIIHTRDDSY